MPTDHRLIEAISAKARLEKPICKEHISTLRLW